MEKQDKDLKLISTHRNGDRIEYTYENPDGSGVITKTIHESEEGLSQKKIKETADVDKGKTTEDITEKQEPAQAEKKETKKTTKSNKK